MVYRYMVYLYVHAHERVLEWGAQRETFQSVLSSTVTWILETEAGLSGWWSNDFPLGCAWGSLCFLIN